MFPKNWILILYKFYNAKKKEPEINKLQIFKKQIPFTIFYNYEMQIAFSNKSANFMLKYFENFRNNFPKNFKVELNENKLIIFNPKLYS